MKPLDRIDRELLRALQEDGSLSTSQLAERVALSASPAFRRVKALEKAGVIRSYVALLDRHAIGLHLLAFAQITLDDHHPDTVAHFNAFVEQHDEILECCALSGEYDYLLKVCTADMLAYEHFLQGKLLARCRIRSVNTSFAMSQRKFTTAFPVEDQ